MRKLTGMMTALLIWLGAAGTAAGICGNGPPLPPDELSWPLAGEISSTWTLDCESDRGHRGVDISAAAGSPVRAAATGRVIFVGYTPAEGGGTTISIEHPGGLRSTYLHIEQPAVSRGDEVGGGQALGLAGEKPLHFGLKLPGERDSYFNPLELIGPLPGAPMPAVDPETVPSPLAETVSQAAPSAQPIAPADAAQPAGLAPGGAPAAEPQPSTVMTATPPAALSTLAALPPVGLTGYSAALLPPASAMDGSAGATSVLFRPGTDPAMLFASLRGFDVTTLGAMPRQIWAAFTPGAARSGVEGARSGVPGLKLQSSSRNGSLPAAAFIALLMAVLVAIRLTGRRVRLPKAASALPTGLR